MSHIVSVYAGNFPEHDRTDTNMIHQIPGNESGPPHSFTVNNFLPE